MWMSVVQCHRCVPTDVPTLWAVTDVHVHRDSPCRQITGTAWVRELLSSGGRCNWWKDEKNSWSGRDSWGCLLFVKVIENSCSISSYFLHLRVHFDLQVFSSTFSFQPFLQSFAFLFHSRVGISIKHEFVHFFHVVFLTSRNRRVFDWIACL